MWGVLREDGQVSYLQGPLPAKMVSLSILIFLMVFLSIVKMVVIHSTSLAIYLNPQKLKTILKSEALFLCRRFCHSKQFSLLAGTTAAGNAKHQTGRSTKNIISRWKRTRTSRAVNMRSTRLVLSYCMTTEPWARLAPAQGRQKTATA